MKSEETNEVGQAVFGYSNGHRLLASTVDLSSVDAYELAAASDLAPGAQLTGDASYLTGIFLPESRTYALTRTWLAPEMHRPGCVWSHVLLLDSTTMATQIDLGVLLNLHVRPNSYASNLQFASPIYINRRLRAGSSDLKNVERVLLACYSDFLLDAKKDAGQRLEEAILAVWSQQWPRLRRQFHFRSIWTSSDLKGQTLRFSNTVSRPSPTADLSWLEAASIDATATSITDLRRFLWRYGKDVVTDASTLPLLVQLYAATRGRTVDYSTVDSIFRAFPDGEADTLKGDILGLSSNKMSQVPAISGVDLLEIVVAHQDRDFAKSRGQIASLFSKLGRDNVIDFCRSLYASRSALNGFFDDILKVILPKLDSATLANNLIPSDFAALAVTARPDLIDAGVVTRLTTDQLAEAVSSDLSEVQLRTIVAEVMHRPFDAFFVDILLSHPKSTMSDALKLLGSSALNEGWSWLFRENSVVFKEAIPTLKTGGDLVLAARLMVFPMEPKGIVREWFAQFKKWRSELSADDESVLAAYLVALSTRHGLDEFRDVLAEVLPALRPRILTSDLPRDASNMLSEFLPSDDDWWDLNKRLLKVFRKAHKRGLRFDEILSRLSLNDFDYAYATDQDPADMVQRILQALTRSKSER